MRPFSVLLLAAFILPACSGTNGYGSAASNPDPGTTGVAVGEAPTFHQVYTDVIAPVCLACHVPGGIGVTEGRLDMSKESVAYDNLVDHAAAGAACGGQGTRIVPDEPDSSILYLKVSLDDPTPCGDKMPLGGPPLSQAKADEIEAWISAGAPK